MGIGTTAPLLSCSCTAGAAACAGLAPCITAFCGLRVGVVHLHGVSARGLAVVACCKLLQLQLWLLPGRAHICLRVGFDGWTDGVRADTLAQVNPKRAVLATQQESSPAGRLGSLPGQEVVQSFLCNSLGPCAEPGGPAQDRTCCWRQRLVRRVCGCCGIAVLEPVPRVQRG